MPSNPYELPPERLIDYAEFDVKESERIIQAFWERYPAFSNFYKELRNQNA